MLKSLISLLFTAAFGLGAGTDGVQANIALPIAEGHFVVKAGYSRLPIDLTTSFNVDISSVNQTLDKANTVIKVVSLGTEHIDTRFSKLDINVDATTNRKGSVSLKGEWYPSDKTPFYITAGAIYALDEQLAHADFTTTEQSWTEYNSLKAELTAMNAKYGNRQGYISYELDEMAFNMSGHTYQIVERDNRGYVGADILVNRLKPYIGLGFGKSVPDSHIGIQVELGAMFQGMPQLVSEQEIDYDENAPDVGYDISWLGNMYFWPQLSLVLTFRP